MAAWRRAFLHLVRCPLTNAQPEQDDLGRGRSDELSHHSSEGVNGSGRLLLTDSAAALVPAAGSKAASSVAGHPCPGQEASQAWDVLEMREKHGCLCWQGLCGE